jgi:hypothetical protein
MRKFTDHTLDRGARAVPIVFNFLVRELIPMLTPQLKTLGLRQPQSKRTYPRPQQLSADPGPSSSRSIPAI